MENKNKNLTFSTVNKMKDKQITHYACHVSCLQKSQFLQNEPPGVRQ